MTDLSSGRCNRLLAWYARQGRELPWRQTDDPYRIWISEIMLQQTQVKTVLPRYLAWLEQFPTLSCAASASEDQILKAWEGLGYYRRARFIHLAAQRIATDFNGHFPDSFDDILSLPGVGRSTAGAIASFCFAAAMPVLDGNVKRVLKRWHGLSDAGEKELWARAQEAIDSSGDPAAWNQAMMELGATCCTARSPDCTTCPVNEHCLSAFTVKPARETKKRVGVMDLHWLVQLYTCPERGIWLEQRPAGGIWGGLWSPPISELNERPDEEPLHIHQLTHRRLHLYPAQGKTSPQGDGRWVRSIEGYALPTGIHRLLEKACL